MTNETQITVYVLPKNKYNSCIVCYDIEDNNKQTFKLIKDWVCDASCNCIYPIHRSCLVKWFIVKEREECILCHQGVTLRKTWSEKMGYCCTRAIPNHNKVLRFLVFLIVSSFGYLILAGMLEQANYDENM